MYYTARIDSITEHQTPSYDVSTRYLVLTRVSNTGCVPYEVLVCNNSVAIQLPYQYIGPVRFDEAYSPKGFVYKLVISMQVDLHVT